MIDLDDADIVRRCQTMDGRFLLFHRVDLPPTAILPWSGVVLDIGGDGIGLSVRLDPVPDSWAACDLLRVALERAKAEEGRRLGPLVVETVQHLMLALKAEEKRLGTAANRVRFQPGPMPSAYPWTEVALGPHILCLCSDPESRDEGVSPEQVLMVLDQMLGDADSLQAQQHWLGIARDHVLAALTAERRRVAHLRSGA